MFKCASCRKERPLSDRASLGRLVRIGLIVTQGAVTDTCKGCEARVMAWAALGLLVVIAFGVLSFGI